MAITVKVTRTGAEVKEVALAEGSKVSDALRAARITLGDGEVVTRDGAVVSQEDVLHNGNIFFVEENDENGSN